MKIKKATGLSYEESLKSLQLKGEIDNIVDQKNIASTEDSNSLDISSWDLSPRSKEKIKIENKYKKKLGKVMETFIDRVDNHSSSSNNSSGDEKYSIKKRKYTEFLNGLKFQNNQ